MSWAKRYGLVLTGIALVVVAAICATTPLLWRLQGSPPESYPELFAAAYLLPAAVVIATAGVAWGWSRRAWARHGLAMFWSGAALVIIAWLLCFVWVADLVPEDPAAPLGSTTVIVIHFHAILLGTSALVAIGWLVRKTR